MGLQLKLFSIYILALALSGCIVTIFLQEIKVIHEIESEKDEMRRQYSVMDDVRSRVIELYAIGEYVLGWDENDYAIYRTKRLATGKREASQNYHADCKTPGRGRKNF